MVKDVFPMSQCDGWTTQMWPWGNGAGGGFIYAQGILLDRSKRTTGGQNREE